jgi:hypothetical protein
MERLLTLLFFLIQISCVSKKGFEYHKIIDDEIFVIEPYYDTSDSTNLVELFSGLTYIERKVFVVEKPKIKKI